MSPKKIAFIVPPPPPRKAVIVAPTKSDFEKSRDVYQDALTRYQNDPPLISIQKLHEAAIAAILLAPDPESRQALESQINRIVQDVYHKVTTEFESLLEATMGHSRKPTEAEYLQLRSLALEAESLAPDEKAQGYWKNRVDVALLVYVKEVTPDLANYEMASVAYQKAAEKYNQDPRAEDFPELCDLAIDARRLAPNQETRKAWDAIINTLSQAHTGKKYLYFHTENEIQPFKTASNHYDEYRKISGEYYKASEAYNNNQHKTYKDLSALRALAWEIFCIAPAISRHEWTSTLDTLAKDADKMKFDDASANYAKARESYDSSQAPEKLAQLYELAQEAQDFAPDPETSAQWKEIATKIESGIEQEKIKLHRERFFTPKADEKATPENSTSARRGILKKSSR